VPSWASPLLAAWYIAGPVTYIVAVADTWHSPASVPVKLLISLTLDAILAGVWPVAWLLWIIEYFAGLPSPLRLLFG